MRFCKHGVRMSPDVLSEIDSPGGQHSRILAAVSAVAEPLTIRAAWLLSTVVAIERDAFVKLLEQLWPQDSGHEKAVSAILSWPFVECTDDGYRMSDATANAFRLDFLQADEPLFRRAHELLAALEADRETDDDPDETWFVRGRYAYYLAGFDQDNSIRVFGDGFAEPPRLDRTDARMWLSWLVIQQEDLLDEVPRAIAFFRGFRAYISGARQQARGAFDAVLKDEEVDIYRALAAHFSGLLRRGDEPDAGIELLRESISLSVELGLTENEIMARNSLVTGLIANPDVEDLTEAWELGELNLERALATQDPYLIAWCRTTSALSHWSYLTNRRMEIGEQAHELAPRLVAELDEVVREVFFTETETALQATNEAACILRDVGAYDEALGLLQGVIAKLARVDTIPKQHLKRLSKTTGSMLKDAGPDRQSEVREMLAQLDDLQR
jgi:hypothetical protein